MEFFDRKSEVYDFQITSYGKYLISVGEFEPVYYSFSDNDIVYDSNHSNFLENLNDIHDRITLTPRTKSQTHFSNFESGSNFSKISTFDKVYSEGTLLGTSTHDDKVPSFELNFHKSEISSSVQFLTGAIGDIYIPQINLKDVYVTLKIENIDNFDILENPLHGNLDICESLEEFEFFPDSTVFKVENGEIVVEVSEMNAPFNNKNFTFEIFEVDGNDLKPLKMLKDFNNVVDDILVDDEDEEIPEINEEFLEYYFQIEIDEEIDKELRKETSKEVNNLYDFNIENLEEC